MFLLAAIPSSQPQRQSSGGSNSRNRRGNNSWYDNDDDDDNFGTVEQERRPLRSARRSKNDSNWDDNNSSAGGGWGDFSADDSSYDPYVYDKPSTSSRGDRSRGARDFDTRGGGGRGRRDGGRNGKRREGRGRGGDSGRGRGDSGRGRGGNKRFDRREESKSNAFEKVIKTNLKAIENAGYEHLYGIAPVLNALKANIRDFTDPEDKQVAEKEDILELQRRLSGVDGADWEEDNVFADNEEDKEIKPEAKLAPCLFVQDGTLDNTKRSFRSTSKNEASSEIISLAQQIGLNIAEVDKGVLNTLCGNRPHQGFVLRCGGLEFAQLKSKNLPFPNEGGECPSLWLALDEVVDPQNLGALLRSAYFLGGGSGVIGDGSSEDSVANGRVGILVCSKNSAPLTPTVSAASAGALEFMTVYSTSNLPKVLNTARDDGWRILGAAAEAPDTGTKNKHGGSAGKKLLNNNSWDLGNDLDEEEDENSDITQYMTSTMPHEERGQKCLDLNEVELGKPTVLVLGSEGRGLRTLVARACSDFVQIPGGSTGADDDTQAGVDSLNVSVSGGIFLFHFCRSLNN